MFFLSKLKNSSSSPLFDPTLEGTIPIVFIFLTSCTLNLLICLQIITIAKAIITNKIKLTHNNPLFFHSAPPVIYILRMNMLQYWKGFVISDKYVFIADAFRKLEKHTLQNLSVFP